MNLLLAVTGSISAYKTLDITREWVKAGHSVKVVLTAGALQFVVPQVFKYLGASEVFLPLDDFKYPKEEQDPGSVLHIELGKWADKLILAPLSANSLSRIVSGQAGDLLNSVFLAFDPGKPVLAFPAMNTKMLDHPFVERNLELLDELPNVFVHPSSSGELACGDIGAGKLPTVDTILTATEAVSLKTIDKQAGLKKHILISTGATVSPLDPVRYLTNASSGITGYHLAIESLKRGHKVTVVAGKFATAKLELLTHLPHFQLLRVTTATEMASVLDKYFSYADSYISAAAISDIEFEFNQSKLKKDGLKGALPTKPGFDILANLLAKKTHQKIVGFAAETELTSEVLLEKFNRKPVDLLVGTKVNNGLGRENKKVEGFSNLNADYGLMQAKGQIAYKSLSKSGLAKEILERITL